MWRHAHDKMYPPPDFVQVVCPTYVNFAPLAPSSEISPHSPFTPFFSATPVFTTDIRKGRWTSDEHRLFLKGLELHGKGWKQIATLIQTRTVVQIRWVNVQSAYFTPVMVFYNGVEALLPSPPPVLFQPEWERAPSRADICISLEWRGDICNSLCLTSSTLRRG